MEKNHTACHRVVRQRLQFPPILGANGRILLAAPHSLGSYIVCQVICVASSPAHSSANTNPQDFGLPLAEESAKVKAITPYCLGFLSNQSQP